MSTSVQFPVSTLQSKNCSFKKKKKKGGGQRSKIWMQQEWRKGLTTKAHRIENKKKGRKVEACWLYPLWWRCSPSPFFTRLDLLCWSGFLFHQDFLHTIFRGHVLVQASQNNWQQTSILSFSILIYALETRIIWQTAVATFFCDDFMGSHHCTSFIQLLNDDNLRKLLKWRQLAEINARTQIDFLRLNLKVLFPLSQFP